MRWKKFYAVINNINATSATIQLLKTALSVFACDRNLITYLKKINFVDPLYWFENNDSIEKLLLHDYYQLFSVYNVWNYYHLSSKL